MADSAWIIPEIPEIPDFRLQSIPDLGRHFRQKTSRRQLTIAKKIENVLIVEMIVSKKGY